MARDITLDDPIYGRMAEADELRIRPSFRALLRGGIELKSIEVRGADLRLVVRNGQVRNLPRLETGGASGPPTLPFDELHVYDSTLTVDAEPLVSGQLRNVELHVSETDRGVAIEANSSDGWLRHEGGRETIQLIDGRIEITENTLFIPELDLQTPDARVAVVEGEAPMTFGEHGYRGQIELEYDLTHIEQLPIPEEITLPPFRGRIEANLTLTSEGRDQGAEGSIDLYDVTIEEFGIGEHVTLLVDADRSEVRILEGSTSRIVREGGQVDLAGTISLDPETGFAVDVRAEPNELSFGGLMSTLGVTDDGIVEWLFNGTMDLDGTLDPLNLEGPVHLATHDFRVTHGPYHERPIRRVISVTRGGFEGRWSIRDDAVRFENLVGDLPHSRIRGEVHLGFDNQLRVTANTDGADLRDITPLDRWPLHGTGNANVAIDGTFQDPVVAGHVRFEDFIFDTWRLGTVESDALLDPDGLGVHFAMVQAVKNESQYRVEDLYLDFHHDRFEMTGLMHLDGFLLADFYHVFGFEADERFTPYQGLTRGQASLHYTNGFPDDSPSGTLDVDMNIGLDWANLNDYAFEDGRLVGRWRWLDWDRGAAGAELTLAHVSLRKGEGTITLDGEMTLGGHLRMNAVADRIALSQLEGIGDRLEGIGGVATAIGRIGGTFDVMQADFDVGITNVTYDGGALGDGRFFVRHTDTEDPYVVEASDWDRSDLPREPCAEARSGLAHADWPADPPVQTVEGPMERLVRPMAFLICGSGLDERLHVDVAVGRTEALPLRGVIRLDDLDLSPMLPRMPDGDPLRGGVSGVIAIQSGSMRDLETLEGTVRLGEVYIAQADLEVRNRVPVELAFKDGVLAVLKARFVGPDSRIRLRGRASLDEGLALHVDGDIDLGLAARLSRSVTEASGQVEASFNVTGEMSDPELYGSAEVSNGSLRFASFDSEVENLSGRVQFSERSVLFESFEAQVAGGRVRASGSAELRDSGIERYDLSLEGRSLTYDFAEGVDLGFGASANLSWSRGERLPTLRGEMRVSRFEYTRPIELRSLGDVAATAVQGAFRSERTEVRRYDPEEDMVALDVRVAQRAPFRIRNNLIEATVRIEGDDRPFRIVGTDQRYGVEGAMQISRGQISFQNNQFDVTRGRIQFDDATRIDPHLDIEAATEIRRSSDLSAPSWRIHLSLTGSADNLRLETRSDPDLPEPDILMLLAFGMTRAEMQTLQQGGDLASAAAVEALAAVTGVDREVRRALPIDDIRVTTGYSVRTGRSEPRLSVGTRIADRVRLGATTGLGESREFRGTLDWQLDDNQRLGISYDNYNINGANSFGNLGIDWGYRLEFR